MHLVGVIGLLQSGDRLNIEDVEAAAPTGFGDQRDVLIVKADRQEPLVVVRLSLAAVIAKHGVGEALRPIVSERNAGTEDTV